MSAVNLYPQRTLVTVVNGARTTITIRSPGVQGPPGTAGADGPEGPQGPQGPAGAAGDEFGIYVTGSPVPLGGYPAARSARASGSFSRFFAEVDAECTIEVRVDGAVAHTAAAINGTVSQAVDFDVAAGSTVDFWVSGGTPGSVWAQIDGGTP